MALDLVRATQACLRFSELAGPALSPTVAEIVTAVVDRLGARPAPDTEKTVELAARTNRSTVVSALVAVGADAVATAPAGARRDAARFAKSLTDGTLSAELANAFDSATFAGTLAEASDMVRLCGLDAERLLDGVIRHEAGRHTGLVWHQVNRVVGNYPGYGPDELFGFGWRGLCVALHNYDPERVAFSTYACTRICGNIADGVRAESPIPKRLNTWYRKVTSTTEALTFSLGRPPTESEVASAVAADRLARELGRPATLAEVANALETERNQLSLLPRLAVPAPLDEAPTSTVVDDPAEDAVRSVLRADVRAALRELPAEERDVIELLELNGLSIDDTAKTLGTSTRQVRTLRQRGRVRLAERLAGWREESLVPA